VRSLCTAALDAAVAAGAAYADVRAVVRRAQSVATRNGAVETVSDVESAGLGIRVLVDGAWGFACDGSLSEAGARDAALRACGFARASANGRRRVLAPLQGRSGSYRTPFEIDPFSVPLADKVALCLRADEALRLPEVKVRLASAWALGEQKLLLTSDGVEIEQDLVESGAGVDAIATCGDITQVRSYPSAHGGQTQQAGWEYVLELALEREAPRVAAEAVALCHADPCPSLRTTVVIDGEQMALQVHESVGHPTELDRVYGTEAAYAGTSFLSANDLGSLRYGSALMNITADATTPRGLGTFAFDDEGVAARREPVVVEGVLRGFLTSRETAARLGAGAGGSMRAEGWSRMPLVRMTNLHLEPGAGTLDDLLADVDEGVYLETNRSWSIDDKRLNFQFGTQAAWEIRKGRRVRMLRDATYTGITPVFWGSLDAVAGLEDWGLHGFTNCGKGQPGQLAHVSHGAAPCRFRDVVVGVVT
jgi:TldD protein